MASFRETRPSTRRSRAAAPIVARCSYQNPAPFETKLPFLDFAHGPDQEDSRAICLANSPYRNRHPPCWDDQAAVMTACPFRLAEAVAAAVAVATAEAVAGGEAVAAGTVEAATVVRAAVVASAAAGAVAAVAAAPAVEVAGRKAQACLGFFPARYPA